MKKSNPTNQEAYYAHKMRAIQRRKELLSKLPCRLVWMLYILFWTGMVALPGYLLIYSPIKEHDDWVKKVDAFMVYSTISTANLGSRVDGRIREVEKPDDLLSRRWTNHTIYLTNNYMWVTAVTNDIIR